MLLRIFILLIAAFAAFPTLAAGDCSGRLIEKRIFAAPVCISEKAEKIVVLDPFYNLGMALELDLPLIGAPLFSLQDDGLRAAAEKRSVADIGDAREPSLERIVRLKPDLIIGDATLHGRHLDTFRKIAPTVLIDVRNWKDHFLTLGEITGRADAAAGMLQSYETRLEEIRKQVPSTPVSVIRVTPTGFHLYLDGPAAYAPYAILREAGVKRTAYETTTDDTVFKRPDWEDLEQLDGSILLYVVAAGYDRDADDALAARTTANPFWQMLPAVQNGQAWRVERATWMGFNGLASAHRVLDDIERHILKKP